jgi:hypothetical protein
MPYTIKKSKKKNDPRPWKIVKEDTGEVVGTSKTHKDAIGSIAHREDAMKKGGENIMKNNKNTRKTKMKQKNNKFKK